MFDCPFVITLLEGLGMLNMLTSIPVLLSKFGLRGFPPVNIELLKKLSVAFPPWLSSCQVDVFSFCISNLSPAIDTSPSPAINPSLALTGPARAELKPDTGNSKLKSWLPSMKA